MAHPHHIVIIGGGAGGLELATRLGDTLGRRKQAHITLVDKNRTHIWKPKRIGTLARLILRRTEPHVKLH